MSREVLKQTVDRCQARLALAVVLGCGALFLGAALWAYNPSRGLMAARR